MWLEALSTHRYQHLRQPSWKPPRITFAIVWPILYTLMGTASWLVWHNGGWQQHSRALLLYAIQLVLNLSWPPLFFSGHKLGLALADSTGEACNDINNYDIQSLLVCPASVDQAVLCSVQHQLQVVELQRGTCTVGLQQSQKYSFGFLFAALLAAVAATTQLFWDAEPAAGKLLLPYLAWTAYATLLNAWIWNKNPKVQLPCLSAARALGNLLCLAQSRLSCFYMHAQL